MTEDLQGLLDRIQKDGVEKGEADAARIIEEAKAKAADIVKKAEADADALRKQAEEDGKLFEERGKSAISHAARDVILSVGEAIAKALKGIVSSKVDAALGQDEFPALVKDVVTAYCSGDTSGEGIEVLLSPEQQEKVSAFFIQEMAGQMKAGLTIKGDKSIVSGFTVSMKDGGVHHDFTGTALTESLCTLLRPQLAEIIKSAMSNE